MADDELHPVGGKIIGDRDALFRIGDIVAELDGQLLAQYAAGSVDIGGCLFDAVLHLRAGRRIGTGNRAADPEFHLGCGGFHERKRETQRKNQRGDPLHI